MSAEADAVSRTADSPGWKVIEAWIEKEIEALRLREEKQGDIDNPTTHVLSEGADGYPKVLVMSVDKGYAKHAARAYRKLQSKIKDWERESQEEGGG